MFRDGVTCRPGMQACAGVGKITEAETPGQRLMLGSADVTVDREDGTTGGRMATISRPTGNRLAEDDSAQGVPFASSWRRAHLTVDQRVGRGRAARGEAPRSAHGRWEAAPDRPDPVALLEEQAATRVPELVPIRY